MLENIIIDVIKTCYDPEIPTDESLPQEVEDKIRGIKDVKSAKVNITFEPPWEMSMISEEARLEMGMM